MTLPFLRIAIILLLVCCHGISSEVAQGAAALSSTTALRVMSFNIRYSGAADGKDVWPNRKDQAIAAIRTFDPDLLGLQEVVADQYDTLVETFSEYAPVGVARDDGARKGEWSAILYRKSRFEKIDSGNFWLSDSPETVASMGWDAACVRICTWAKLRDLTTKKEILFANTHFDHKGILAQKNSALLLRKRLPKLAGDAPVILSGDFNCTEDSEPYKILVGADSVDRPEEKQLFDSFRLVHPDREKEEASFHGFKGRTAGSRIDWILHTAQLKPVSAEIVRSNVEGRFPSDHYPVTAVLEWQ